MDVAVRVAVRDLARALWSAHQPGTDGMCPVVECWEQDRRHPCPVVDLALEGMRAACGEATFSAPLWQAVARRNIAAVLDLTPTTRWPRNNTQPTDLGKGG